MGLYDEEFKDIGKRMDRIESERPNASAEDQLLLRELERNQRSVRSELTGTGIFRLALVGLFLLMLSGCTVHTHTWDGPPPVVYQPVVVQHPVVVQQRPQVIHHRRWRADWRVAARPRAARSRPQRRRGYHR
jgi:hypothetical protein